MKWIRSFLVALLSLIPGLALRLSAQDIEAAAPAAGFTESNAASSRVSPSSATSKGCNTANGTRFNLEPLLNAQPQQNESVAFLLDRVSPGVDLVVGAANESAVQSRFLPGANNGVVFDAFYAHRTGANCNPDFEGTTRFSTTNPKVVADSARDAFFLAADVITGAAVELVTRTPAATLLSSSACPNGTQQLTSSANATCWPVEGAAFFNPSPATNEVLLGASLAVDPRTSGTGEGDVYVAAQLENTGGTLATSTIQVIACTNQALSCGTSVIASGADTFAARPWMQVRADGVLTISYWTFANPASDQPPNAIDIKFTSCTPRGAPQAPACSPPQVVASTTLLAAWDPGDNDFSDSLFPKHSDRREADGSFTTFLVYDRCRSIHPPQLLARLPLLADTVCTKVDLVLTQSTNGGATWSTPELVESAVGHQFFGTIAVDASTGTTNITYYSTQNDPFLQRAQLFLSQIPAGSTTPNPAVALTAASTDPNVGIQNLVMQNGVNVDVGDYIGLAVAGTGTKGQSKVYVHYTWNNVFGISNGTEQPDPNNTLVPFSY
ncbi:MAG TPA: hypothetical protein VEK33_03965 [Terriglobales bacterium]|nr:hypothetical protein [Terriglobales bacterium]